VVIFLGVVPKPMCCPLFNLTSNLYLLNRALFLSVIFMTTFAFFFGPPKPMKQDLSVTGRMLLARWWSGGSGGADGTLLGHLLPEISFQYKLRYFRRWWIRHFQIKVMVGAMPFHIHSSRPVVSARGLGVGE